MITDNPLCKTILQRLQITNGLLSNLLWIGHPHLSVAQNVLTYVLFGILSFMFLHVVAGGLIFLQTEIFMQLELQHISGFFGGSISVYSIEF
jgi:hypothetical protein